MFKKLIFAITVLALAQICANAESLPAKNIVFLSNNHESMVQNAISNGAREAFKDLGARYNTEFAIKNITPLSANSTGIENQADILSSALQQSENIGAIVIPNLSKNEKLSEAVNALAEKKKPVALISTDIPESKRIFFVESDTSAIVKTILDEINPHLRENNFKLLVIYSGKEDIFNAPEPKPSRVSQKALLDAFKGKPYVQYASSVYFSEFAKKFQQEIEDLDNYGIIFLSASPLINSVPIKRDSDRDFIIVMSLRPHLGQYLRNKEISMCIDGDYFGYGYLSAIAVAEKYFEDKNPPKDKRVLAPIKYKVYQTSDFDKNWNALFK